MNDPFYFFLAVFAGVAGARLISMAIYKNCAFSGHDFKPNGNVDICSKCELIRRKVKR